MLDLNTVVLIGGLALNMVGTAIVGTWKLSRVELGLREAISTAERETDDRIQRQARETGETVAAIRQKITEVELFIRDTFMRRDSFVAVQESIDSNIKSFCDRIEQRLERMEGKIDTKT